MSKELARYLRRNSTDAETVLWNLLRSRQLAVYKFRRQRPIGKYVADFACLQYRLIVEADGGQHVDNPQDEERSRQLEKLGWKIIRFWNSDILSNPDGVLLTILDHLRQSEPRYGKAATEPSPSQI